MKSMPRPEFRSIELGIHAIYPARKDLPLKLRQAHRFPGASAALAALADSTVSACDTQQEEMTMAVRSRCEGLACIHRSDIDADCPDCIAGDEQSDDTAFMTGPNKFVN
jgi:hypothetical protein